MKKKPVNKGAPLREKWHFEPVLTLKLYFLVSTVDLNFHTKNRTRVHVMRENHKQCFIETINKTIKLTVELIVENTEKQNWPNDAFYNKTQISVTYHLVPKAHRPPRQRRYRWAWQSWWTGPETPPRQRRRPPTRPAQAPPWSPGPADFPPGGNYLLLLPVPNV